MSKKPRIPGDLSDSQEIAQIIRVNHAGEYGAKRIYEGQLKVLKGTPAEKTIEHMKDQELEHLEYFSNAIVKNRVRPTLLQPIWHFAGFALGAITAKLGPKAAMACTVAVEEVINEHYLEQLEALKGAKHHDLREKIEKFRQDELEHKETALENKAEDAVGYPILSAAIKTASRTAIWLSKRI